MRFLFKNLSSFLLILSLPLKLWAWNEDYNDFIPSQRSVCIKNLSSLWKGATLTIRSIPPDESCSIEEARYQWVIGKEPKDSMALIPMKTLRNPFPPWVVSWPSSENSASPRVWHFSCIVSQEKKILGTLTKSFSFKGEITAPSKNQSCESAYTMAQGACMEQLGGNELYEQCSGGSNLLLEYP